MARWSRNCHGLVQVFCYYCQADCVAALGLLGQHYSLPALFIFFWSFRLSFIQFRTFIFGLSGDLLSPVVSRGQHASLLYSLFSLAQALPIGTRSYQSM